MTHYRKALTLAKRTGEPAAVCEIDHDEDRATRVYRLDYTTTGEFDAFDGRILAVVYPDGMIEA